MRLSKCGVTLWEKDQAGNSPINHVVETGNEDLVKIVTEHFKEEPTFLDQPNVSGQTAIFVAARIGNSNIVNTLLSSKCDPTRRDKTGFTPLHTSTLFGHLEISQIFMSRGCDPFTYDIQRQSPASIAEQIWEGAVEDMEIAEDLRAVLEEEEDNQETANPAFQKKFIKQNAAVLRKFFPRPASVLTAELIRITRANMAKKQEPDVYEEEASDSLEIVERGEEDGDEEDGEEEEGEEGEQSRPGTGGSTALVEAAKSGADEASLETEGSDDGDATEASGEIDYELEYPDLLRAYDALRNAVAFEADGILEKLAAKRDKYAELRDLFVPGWQDD